MERKQIMLANKVLQSLDCPTKELHCFAIENQESFHVFEMIS